MKSPLSISSIPGSNRAQRRYGKRSIGCYSCLVAARFDEIKLEYMIWIDGNTENTESAGSMSCGIGPGSRAALALVPGAQSEYVATIWDFTDKVEVGRVSAKPAGRTTCRLWSY